MKVLAHFIFTIGILLSCLRCMNNDSNAVSQTTVIGSISFDTLKIGQISRYVAFRIHDDTVKNYIADTLILKVHSKIESSFVVYEYYSKGSASYVQGGDIGYFLLRIVNGDTLRHFRYGSPYWGSQLLWQNKTYSIPLSFKSERAFDIDTIRPSYCIMNAFMGAVTHVSVASTRLDNLLIINDNSETNSDSPGYVYVFNKRSGIVVSMMYSLFESAIGWELLPEQ